MASNIFRVSGELTILLLGHLSSGVSALFHDDVCWSWSRAHGSMGHSDRLIPPLNACLWHPYLLVVEAYVLIEVILYLVYTVLELSHFFWDFFALGEHRQILKLFLDVRNVFSNGTYDILNSFQTSIGLCDILLIFEGHQLSYTSSFVLRY